MTNPRNRDGGAGPLTRMTRNQTQPADLNLRYSELKVDRA